MERSTTFSWRVRAMEAKVDRLQFAVDAVYTEMLRLGYYKQHHLEEIDLWRELAYCLLGSQVRYELAWAATLAIVDLGALPWTINNRIDAEHRIHEVLTDGIVLNGRRCTYRFPNVKSNQLAETGDAIMSQAGSLRDFLSGFSDADLLRAWMVRCAPGLGPKQASMFLRNIGLTFDQAVLDRHVVRYMETIELIEKGGHHTTSLSSYRVTEDILRQHAEDLGYRVGLMDNAIWIVMRVAGYTGFGKELAT